MKLGNANPYIIDFDPFSTSTQQQMELGASLNISDGRIFRYAKSGAANQSAGKINTAPAQKTNHQNVTVQAASAIGSTSVSVTLGATASVAQEYVEGLFVVGLTPGQGHAYKISNQPATLSAGVQTITTFDPIQVALTTSSKGSLVHNAWNATIEGTVQTIRPAGVAMTPITASSTLPPYFWDQTRGVASVLNDQAIALGSWLTLSASVSGAVIAMSGTYGTALLTPKVGEMTVKVGVDGQYEPCFLSID